MANSGIGNAACERCLQKVCLDRPSPPNCRYAVGDTCKIPFDCPLEVPRIEWQSPFIASELPSQYKAPMSVNASAMNAHFQPWDAPSSKILHYLHTGALRLISLDPEKIRSLGSGKAAEIQLAGGGGSGSGSAKKEEAPNDVEPTGAVIDPKHYALENARWAKVPADGEAAGKEEKTESASTNNAVLLMVDSVDLSPGDNVIFSVFKADDNAKVATLSGLVGYKRPDDAAVVRWVVNYAGGKEVPEGTEFYFVAKFPAKSLEEKSGKVKIGPAPWEILLEIDVDDPKAKDDTLILIDESGKEIAKAEIGKMKEISKDMIKLTFENVNRKTKYSLIRDHGADEDGGRDFIFENLSPEELKEHCYEEAI